MHLIRQYRHFWIFAAAVFVCALLVLRQYQRNASRHVELREAFVLLHGHGYHREAQRLFQRLVVDLETLPDALLQQDYERTLLLVNPARSQPENLLWKYHWTLHQELEKRAQGRLASALRLAEDP